MSSTNRICLSNLALALLAGAFVALSGCRPALSGNLVASSPGSTRPQLSGVLHGGQQPVIGSIVTVWAAGSSGLGSGATALASTTSGAFGAFSIPPGTYSCAGVTTPLYVTAQGGNPGNAASVTNPTGNNPDIFLVAGLGTCGAAEENSFVNIDEVTTVAAAFSLASSINAANFGSSTNFGIADSIGSSSSSDLTAAFINAASVANNATGTSPGSASLATLATPKINALANILAGCINSDPVNGSTACTTLFADASPTTSGSTPVAGNTFEAAYYLDTNPTSTNGSGSQIAALYGMIDAQAPFQPSLTSQPANWSVDTACNVPGGTSNVPIPAGCAYFGAWANPAAGGTSPAQVNCYTTALESQLGRTLSLHMHYYGWGTPGATVAQSSPAFPDQAMTNDASAGRTPVVTWACSGTNSVIGNASSTVDVSDYNLIVATAQAVKAFAKPVFIRWNWEMNLTSGNKCMDSGSNAQQQAGYIAAWRNIYGIFQAQGATNVSWLWNPGGASADPDPAPYYPGSNYVDWIGFDGYDKINANDFGGVFKHFYNEFNSYGKPILIGETGECTGVQQTYLNTAVAEIAGRTNSGNYSFPLVRGLMYFDAPGQYGGCTWNFDSEGISGFTSMGANPYFVALP